ncbi:MAG TPA: Mrp/NBP35 family ATP-binding protein [Melioribacteraceae bacterium]|nr:Mrp/NBP35 family ATP-binding protein [Melioribacteraceae bacterium]
MSNINKVGVIDALSKVIESNSGKDLVSLNAVKDIKIDGYSVIVKLNLPSDINYNKVENDCISAIKEEEPDAKEIIIDFGTNSKSQKKGLNDDLMPGVKYTIAVASGKGGVGKSTVAVNLAVALANEGAKVGLIDADIYGPSIPLMFGLTNKPQINADPLTNKMLPIENYGVKLISIGFFINDNDPIIWRGPMASGAVKQFMSDVEWGELDYLIYDLPPGTGDIQLTLVQTIPLTGAVIVTTPQDVSLIDAKKGLKMFERVNVPVFGIIENMSYFIAPDTGKRYDIFGNGGGEKLADDLKTPFLGGIPINPDIRIGGDIGSPIVVSNPKCAEALQFTNIAKNLMKEVTKVSENLENDKIDIIIEN